MEMNYKIVLLRHGESVWNAKNIFTGWTDIGLSELGIKEAKEAGKILKKEGYVFDLVFTSVLKRAIDTADLVLEEMGQANAKIKYAWQLNERHYGGLQGMNKKEMVKNHGERQVHLWRRSFDVRPPEMTEGDYQKQRALEIFSGIPKDKIPRTESLEDTCARAIAYWNSDIAPAIKADKKILISAHGNSLRAIVKFLDNIGDDEISELNIPTGVPLVYELDDNLKPMKHYYLGDEQEIAKKIEGVKTQYKI